MTQGVTIWCGFWAQGMIGFDFFEDDDGNRGECCKDMLTGYLWLKLTVIDIENDATYHASQIVDFEKC